MSLAVSVIVMALSFKNDLLRRAFTCPLVWMTANPARAPVCREACTFRNHPFGKLKLLSQLK